jgi:hypothetical protein
LVEKAIAAALLVQKGPAEAKYSELVKFIS